MRVDGRDVTVSGSLLQPLTRRTNDIVRLGLATVFLVVVVTSSLITRNDRVSLEKSVSRIVGVLTPTQSNLVYLLSGVDLRAAVPDPDRIDRRAAVEDAGAYAAAGFIAVFSLSITGNGISAPRWHFDLSERLSTTLSQFLDDPRWIAMLAAVLTVSGPWLPPAGAGGGGALLLAFVPIHLVVSAIVPARSLLGLAVGWFVGALTVLVVGTPALEVPLDGAIRALSRRGFSSRPDRGATGRPRASGTFDDRRVRLGRRRALRVEPAQRRGAAAGLAVDCAAARPARCGGIASARRRASRADDDRDRRPGRGEYHQHGGRRARTRVDVVRPYPAKPRRRRSRGDGFRHRRVGRSGCCNATRSATATYARKEITVDGGKTLFGGLATPNTARPDEQLQSDIAQLLMTTTDKFGAEAAVRAAIDALDKGFPRADRLRRLTKSALPKQIRQLGRRPQGLMTAARDR